MTSKQTERFQQRFGPAGALLSTALPDFPLDVLGLIAEFVMFGVAKKSKKPVLLFSLGLELSGKSDTPATAAKSEGAAVHEFKGASYAVACCPTTCRIWVASDVDVHVMSADGVFLRLAAQGRLASPVAVCFDRQHAYIVDTVLNRVNVCTLDGEWLRSFDHDRGFDAPWGIALHRQHDPPLLFVVDQAHHRICAFTTDGAFVREFGSQGAGPGQFSYPRGIAVSPAGEVCVLDRLNNRVQVFSADGTLLRMWSPKRAGQFHRCCGIAFDRAGHVLIGDVYFSCVQVYDGEGNPITRFGSKGTGPGQFVMPFSVCVDQYGAILVSDAKPRVQAFAFTA